MHATTARSGTTTLPAPASCRKAHLQHQRCEAAALLCSRQGDGRAAEQGARWHQQQLLGCRCQPNVDLPQQPLLLLLPCLRQRVLRIQQLQRGGASAGGRWREPGRRRCHRWQVELAARDAQHVGTAHSLLPSVQPHELKQARQQHAVAAALVTARPPAAPSKSVWPPHAVGATGHARCMVVRAACRAPHLCCCKVVRVLPVLLVHHHHTQAVQRPLAVWQHQRRLAHHLARRQLAARGRAVGGSSAQRLRAER